jgi:hypothetical protein
VISAGIVSITCVPIPESAQIQFKRIVSGIHLVYARMSEISLPCRSRIHRFHHEKVSGRATRAVFAYIPRICITVVAHKIDFYPFFTVEHENEMVSE